MQNSILFFITKIDLNQLTVFKISKIESKSMKYATNFFFRIDDLFMRETEQIYHTTHNSKFTKCLRT